MADQIFLNSDALAGLREAGSFGRPLYALYPQLRVVLENELGPDFASLFAEPVVAEQGNRIDWYTQGTGEAVALTSLPAGERAAVHGRLLAAYEQMETLAERYSAAGEAGKAQLGNALKAALTPPADRNIFLVDGRPVVSFWGFFQDQNWGAPRDLAGWRERCRQQSLSRPAAAPGPAPAVSAPLLAAAESTVASAAPPPPADRTLFVVVGSIFFWSVFGLALLLALLAVLFGRSLTGADATIPAGSPPPSADTALAQARDEGATLRARLDRLQLELAERRARCAASPPATPVVPAAPRPEERQEFEQRLAEAGAQRGEITATLLWNNRNDLDLVITCPDGALLYYGNPSACGGQLDVDRNAGETLTAEPVENIFWPGGQAPAGVYKVAVKYYARRDPTLPPATAFQVRLLKDGQEQLFKGTATTPDELQTVTTFKVQR